MDRNEDGRYTRNGTTDERPHGRETRMKVDREILTHHSPTVREENRDESIRMRSCFDVFLFLSHTYTARSILVFVFIITSKLMCTVYSCIQNVRCVRTFKEPPTICCTKTVVFGNSFYVCLDLFRGLFFILSSPSTIFSYGSGLQRS